MSRYGRDPEAIARDLVVALAHPDYRDRRPTDTLRELKQRRLEGRKTP